MGRGDCIRDERLIDCRHAMQPQFHGIALKRVAELLGHSTHERKGFAVGFDGLLRLALAQQYMPQVEHVLCRGLVLTGNAVIEVDGTVIVTQQERAPGDGAPFSHLAIAQAKI